MSKSKSKNKGAQGATTETSGKGFRNIVTAEKVASWCKSIKESGKVGATCSLMRAFRWASHYGDDEGGDSSARLGTMSSSVLNTIMIFVLTEMDGILWKLLKLPASGGKRETIKDLMGTRQWKNYDHMVKSYLGNVLHILNQRTNTEMISFTLRRLKCSTLLFAALPSVLRRYIKVALHFWVQGEVHYLSFPPFSKETYVLGLVPIVWMNAIKGNTKAMF